MPAIQIADPVKEIAKKFDFYIKIVIAVLVVAMLTMLFMVGSLILDAFHFNSAVYKEYSEKLQSIEELRTENHKLQQTNEINQTLILDQQRQILEMINDD